eukprot:scaffold196802_cov28-Tisochrysis_lutea.AAC.2
MEYSKRSGCSGIYLLSVLSLSPLLPLESSSAGELCDSRPNVFSRAVTTGFFAGLTVSVSAPLSPGIRNSAPPLARLASRSASFASACALRAACVSMPFLRARSRAARISASRVASSMGCATALAAHLSRGLRDRRSNPTKKESLDLFATAGAIVTHRTEGRTGLVTRKERKITAFRSGKRHGFGDEAEGSLARYGSIALSI